MVWGRIVDLVGGEPKLPPGPTRLPDYFPLEPRGCEHHSQKLFACLANEATEKARDMEKAGLYKSVFPDVEVPTPKEVPVGPGLPKAGENPLDECKTFIAYYKRCCDRELKKPKNWLLTEPYRVQEEYRYAGNKSSETAATK